MAWGKCISKHSRVTRTVSQIIKPSLCNSFPYHAIMDLMADLLDRFDTGRDDLRIDISKYDDNSVIFLDTLLDRARRLDLVPNDPVELVNGDVPDVDVDDLSPRAARELGLRINLLDFCQEGWHWLFDHLTAITGERMSNYWVIEGFHILHKLEERSTGFGATIDDWLETEAVKKGLRKLTNHNWSFTDKEHATSKQGLQVISIWPTSFLTIGYQAAATCAGCWKFLQRIKHDFGNQWIHTAGYDVTGESWLSIAIEHGNTPLIEHLVGELTREQINNTRCIIWHWGREGNTDRRDLDYVEIKHPVVHLIGRKNSKGLELVLDKLQNDLSSLQFLENQQIKLELCKFASPALATRLLVNKEFDISDIKDTSVTTAWHEAARENPYGADFMEWLKVGSSKDEISTIRNDMGQSILEHVVECGKLACVEWLCKNTDLMVPTGWYHVPGGALRLAAESMAPLSLIIFKTILREMPTPHTHDSEVARKLFFSICHGYRSHISGRRDGLSSAVITRYRFLDTSEEHAKWLAIKKCQALVSHLPSTWAGSDELKHAVFAAGMMQCGFLTRHMRTPPPQTRGGNNREYFFGLGRAS